MKHIFFSLFFLSILTGVSAQQKVDRSKPPKAGPAPAIQIGKYSLHTLDNGLKIIVVENHKLPLVSWTISLDNDPLLEGDKAGYVSMAGELLGAGTTNRTKSQLDEQIDFIGATLSTSPGGIYASALSKHTDALLELVSDVLLHPAFPENEIEKVRKQAISALASEKTDPNSISDKIGNLAKYGSDHPYGEFPTEATYAAVTRDDLVTYYTKYFRPNKAYLVVVGDILPEKAVEQARKYFGSWESSPVMEHEYQMPGQPNGNQVVFVPMPGAVQSVIDITYAIDLKPGTLESIQASVLNNVLGGSGFQSRLMQNLREDKAYTYGAYSSISPDEVVGSFSAGASVRNEVTDSSIVELLYEMKKLVEETIADSTLLTVKNIMTGSFARSLEKPQTVANFALNIEKYKLPKDYYETYLKKLNDITVDDVKKIAARLLKPENAYICVVGNKEVIPSLEVFSTAGKIKVLSPEGTAVSEIKPVPAGVTVSTVLTNYINAIGGQSKIAKIKSYELVGKMEMGPMAVDSRTSVITKKPGKVRITMSMQGMEVMKQVFDGQKMASYQMGQKAPASESETLDLKMNADLLAELHYAEYGLKSELKGIEVLDGKECYVLESVYPDGTVSTDYFEVDGGLRKKTIKTSVEDGETSVQEIRYESYIPSETGVLFPGEINLQVGEQGFRMINSQVVINPKLSADLFTAE